MEWLVEFGFSFIDYTYLLYFYHMLIQKKPDLKKAFIGIFFISMIQFWKDRIFLFELESYVIDIFLVTGFIFLYAPKYNLNYCFYALLIDAIFNFSITFFISIAVRIGITIENTLIFGYERIVFALCLKVFVIGVLWLVVKFLVKYRIQDMKTEKITICITVITIFLFNYLLQVAKDNTEILLYTIFLTLVMITNFYIFYRYSCFIREKSQAEIIEQSINITSDYVTKLQSEQENIKKIRHDMKNQLSILSILLKDQQYAEAQHILVDLCEAVDATKTSISGNIFVDAILNQKMSEYYDITFDLDIQLQQDCVIDGKYIISLLSNMIDNACEELRRIKKSSFSLKLEGNQSQLLIIERNQCREHIDFKTDKDDHEHGYGLKIIKEIVNKYEGEILTEVTNGIFELRVILFLDSKN